MRRLIPIYRGLRSSPIRQYGLQRLISASYTTFASSNFGIDTSTTTNETNTTTKSIQFYNNGTINLDHVLSRNNTEESNTKEVPFFYQLLGLLKDNKFNQVITELNSKGAELTLYQLSDIYHLFYQFEKYRHMLTIFAIFKYDMVRNLELLELSLTATYKDKNYQLFDDLFKIYIESTTKHSNANIFNLALKVYLKLDPGLAKQFLYQMFQSDYPINELTIYEYLKVADKELNFQYVKFVVDMLKRYPLTPINDAAYGELYTSYNKYGTNRDIKSLMEFLENRQVLEIESIKVAQFLNSWDFEGSSMEEIWRRLQFFKLQHSLSLENLEKVYKHLYKHSYKKMTIEDILEFERSMKDDGLLVSDSSIQQKIIYHKSNLKELFQYLKSLKDNGSQLDQYIIKATWARISTDNKNYADKVTRDFSKLAKTREFQTPWIDTLPNLLILRSKNNREDKFLVSNRYQFDQIWRKEQVRNFIIQKNEHGIFEMLMDLIRRGIKPDLKTCEYMLKGLSKLESSNIDKVFTLISDLHSDLPASLEITYFGTKIEQLLRRLKSKEQTLPIAERETMINNFALQYQGRLSCENYLQLTSYLIDLHCHKLALNYIGIARSMMNENQQKYMSSIYLLTLKSLGRSKNFEGFIEILQVLPTETTFSLSDYMLARIHEYKTTLYPHIEDTTERKAFLTKYDKTLKKLHRIKKKQKSQLISHLNKFTNLFGEWIDQEAQRTK